MSDGTLRFIHLSDIHFSNRVARFGFDPDRELRSRIVDDVRIMRDKLGDATAVLVSGDIAYAGQRSEYDDAAEWLNDICDAGGCARSEVRLCPGNHDIDQNVIKLNPLIQDGHNAVRRGEKYFDRCTALDQRLNQVEARAMFYSPLAAYNDFAARYESSFFADETSFVWERDFALNDGSTLRIRGLNTALLSGPGDLEGSMFLGSRATTLHKQAGVEYLTMSHHPPNWLMDKRETEQALDGDARIQLFGHEHENRVMPGRDWVKLFAGAVNPHRAEPNWHPGYNIVEVKVLDGAERKLHVDVYAREWQGSPPQFRFIEDRGNVEVHHVELPLDRLPEGWQSPWSDEDKASPPEPGDGHGTSVEAKSSQGTEVPTVTKQQRFRDIVFRFFSRSLAEKNEIVGTLKLVVEEDSRLIDVERFKLQLKRARERDLLDALDEMITRLETGA